jgi:GGDEF domain-containing protein
MSGSDLQPQESYSLYAHEESVIRQAESMLGKLDEVANGVRVLAQAYREGYRETVRLVRISDRMQEELHAANRTLMDQAVDLQRLNDVLHQEIERREALEHELRRIASVDELTGTHTRRHVLELGEHEQRRRSRHGHELAILMMDLDHFKRINDGFGHAAGDQVLRDFGFLLRSSLRKGDIAGRFGGEEFLAVLPETDLRRLNPSPSDSVSGCARTGPCGKISRWPSRSASVWWRSTATSRSTAPSRAPTGHSIWLSAPVAIGS